VDFNRAIADSPIRHPSIPFKIFNPFETRPSETLTEAASAPDRRSGGGRTPPR
jgi:hypothetical protein